MAALLLAVGLMVPDGIAAQPTGTPPPSAAAAAELDGLIDLLKSNDPLVNQAAAERILDIGEPALPAIEAAFTSGRLRAMGQPKIVLMTLRERRSARLLNERLAALASEPREQRFLRRWRGRPNGTVTIATAPPNGHTDGATGGAPRSLSMTVTIAPADRDPPRAIVAELTLDRLLSPRSVRHELLRAGHSVAQGMITDGRLRGTLGDAPIELAAPPPISLDWSIPLLAALMPQELEAEIYLASLDHRSLSISPMSALRCVAVEPSGDDARSKRRFVYEFGSDAASAWRVKIAEESRRIVEIRFGTDLELTPLAQR